MSAPITLLVEDDEAVVDSYSRMFEAEDISIDVAGTWTDALELFRVGGHRLVIADYNLPGDDHGLRLLVEMKLLVPSTRLILISGALSRPAEELAKEVPLIDYFYPKTSTLPDILANHAKSAEAWADEETDWQKVGREYLTPEDVVNSALQEIDDALRADVAKRRGRG